jgi:hypothetical protein
MLAKPARPRLMSTCEGCTPKPKPHGRSRISRMVTVHSGRPPSSRLPLDSSCASERSLSPAPSAPLRISVVSV